MWRAAAWGAVAEAALPVDVPEFALLRAAIQESVQAEGEAGRPASAAAAAELWALRRPHAAPR